MLIEQVKCYLKQMFEHQSCFEEVGVVAEVREKRIAIVSCNSSGSCAGCAASGGCCSGTAASGSGAGTTTQKRIVADNIPHARVGDTVRVQIETNAGIADSSTFLYIATFIMFAFGLVVGYFVATLLPVGVPAALLALLIGAAFMIGTVAVLRVGRQAAVQTSLAKITEIITIANTD